MGKLFKIDLGEADELFLGYQQRKLYQHFRRCCKTKLKQITKYELELNCKYFENNKESLNNDTNKENESHETLLTQELANKINYHYEMNQYAFNLLKETTNNTQNKESTNNDDTKTDTDDNNDDTDTQMTEIMSDIESNFNYNDYKELLYDIAYNDNTRNYKIFKKMFQDKQRNKENRQKSHWSDIYCCIRCGMHLTAKSLVMDENFHGRTGPSFLIQSVFNVDIGPKATRKLHTGMHVVSDVFCRRCSTNVGWYYHEASKLEQQYKISHYVLECCLICTYEQYMISNYYEPNYLLPNLDFNINKRNRRYNEEEDEESDDDDDDEEDQEEEEEEDDEEDEEESENNDSDDTMNDLTMNTMSYRQKRYNETRELPPYMRADHPSFCGVYGAENRRKRKRKLKMREVKNEEKDQDKENDDEYTQRKEKRKRKRKRKHMMCVPDLSRLHRITTRSDDASNVSVHSDPRRGSIKSDYSNSNDSNKTYDDEEDDDDDDDDDDEPLQSDEQRSYNRRRGVRFADMDDEDDDEDEEEEDEDEEQQSITTQESEQSETESDDESDNEAVERVASVVNEQEEHEEVDVD